MTGLLASVNCLQEAMLALQADVDVIDLKQPRQGALGALPTGTVREIVQAVDGRKAVSATVGDLPMQPETVAAAVAAMAQTGVDYVKIGFFPGGDWPGVIAALQTQVRQGTRLIAVLFADAPFDAALIDRLAAAGFSGAMLDTLDKRNGSLTALMPPEKLAQFVARVKQRSLLCGLAGSLSERHIAELLPLQPDYLGFRGALCRGKQRTEALDEKALARIRQALPAVQAHRHALN
ncbi:MAG: (5-formylfuran-3-yl)methyl phosphate synthase [Gammaproteobacteria bacterium]